MNNLNRAHPVGIFPRCTALEDLRKSLQSGGNRVTSPSSFPVDRVLHALSPLTPSVRLASSLIDPPPHPPPLQQMKPRLKVIHRRNQPVEMILRTEWRIANHPASRDQSSSPRTATAAHVSSNPTEKLSHCCTLSV